MATRDQVINNANAKFEFLAVNDRTADPSTLTLLELTGANSASDTAGIQTVDISSFGDGLRMPKIKVGLDSSFSVSGVVTDTPAFAAFKSAADGADAEKEVYCLLTEGNGDTYGFYGLVTDYSQERVQRDVLKFSSTVNVQSDVTFTAAT